MMTMIMMEMMMMMMSRGRMRRMMTMMKITMIQVWAAVWDGLKGKLAAPPRKAY